MTIDEWIVREAIDTLRQANITLLGCTGLDSPQEFAKKCKENETAINRRINNAISLLSSVKEEESNEGRALLYAVEKTAERIKREMIEKAADWIEHMVIDYLQGDVTHIFTYEMISDFRKAMRDDTSQRL